MTTPPFDPPSSRDIAIVSAQLGRPARDVIGIAARCVCGAPTVVSTKPRLSDGTPFPTLYYLSHPAATAAVSTLEATGVMPELAELLGDADPESAVPEPSVPEPSFPQPSVPELVEGPGAPTLRDDGEATSSRQAASATGKSATGKSATGAGATIAARYLAAHEAYLADRNGIEFVPEIDGISAGGMPTRVKCLHALVGHALAAGPGVNPIGDLALERASWSPLVCECVDYGAAA